WKALDFVSLDRSSVSFSINEKLETAMPRWSMARTRAAKVGKGMIQFTADVFIMMNKQVGPCYVAEVVTDADRDKIENNGLIEPKKTEVLMPGMFLPCPSPTPSPNPTPNPTPNTTVTDKEAANSEQATETKTNVGVSSNNHRRSLTPRNMYNNNKCLSDTGQAEYNASMDCLKRK
ncbi:hypothetical protein Tco_1373062, partial [Tanacetum coccineum]